VPSGLPPPRRIALLRAAGLAVAFDPDAPGMGALWAEDDALLEAFRAAGQDAVPVVWNAPGVAWGEFDAAIVRSTWDYIDDLDGFLATLARIEASGCALFNDRESIAWNARKRYLVELASRGVAVMPTRLVTGPADAGSVPAEWSKVVVKPEVGIGAAGIQLVPRAALEETLAKVRGPHLVQPFAGSVATEGEWSFVYIDGRPSHALVKRPAAGDFRVQSIYGGTSRRAEPAARDRADADTVMAALSSRPLYARVDMARLDGRLLLMELELIEPVLFFGLEPDAPRRLVDATLARLSA
jgi:glutathione synthase/RimK-type ligase-like ATP-grasp enzyme